MSLFPAFRPAPPRRADHAFPSIALPRRRALVRALASLLLASAAVAVSAAESAEAEAVADAQTQRGSASGATPSLETVTVTAERREENLQEVPVSVGVVQGDAMRDYTAGGDDTLLALAGRVPALYAETTTGRIFPRFYIRGLGNIDFYLGASQPVSIIQDDVVLEHVVLKSNPVYDLDQVEVLRGPQGSLFGRNTTAGIVKFDSIKPGQEHSGRAQLSYGSYGSFSFDGGVGGPLSDIASFRVSALYQHRDDWVSNRYRGPSADGTATPQDDAMGGYDDRNVRLQLLLQPSENFSLLASGHARDYDGTSTLFLRNAIVKGSNRVDVPRDEVAYDEANNNPQAYKTHGGSLKAIYNFGGISLTSISAYESTAGYSRGDTDGGAAANFPVNGLPNGYGQSMGQVRDLDQYTQEFRLASENDTALQWQAGAFYFNGRDTTDFYQRAWFLTPPANNPNNWVRLRNSNTSWALFGQLSYQVSDALTLTAGVRETDDRKRTRLLKTADTAAGVVTYTGRRDVSLSDRTPSWDLSAMYSVSPEMGLYARVARGFRGPTIQGRSAVFNADFTTADSETILSWEAGIKTSLLDNRLRLNVAGFAYSVDDIQLNGNDSNGNGVLFNADKAKAHGLEADLDWRPLPNLALSAGLSLLKSEIQDKRVYAQVCALNGVVVCTVNDPTLRIGANTFAQIDGNPLPNAPKYTVNLAARYDIPLSDSGTFFIATDWNKQGRTSFVLYDSVEFNANGNVEGGLKLGYSGGYGAYEVALFGRNITNEKNLKGAIENYMAAVYNEPRIIGVSLNYTW
ncbi:iron complex outermembrane receptor protein [Tahibacter aquaticus]|uniref:Iron complex outermembrane receptor protein n=1 Tax=Tahibacter aquaticus TaxID=520092 RepID=A0A4R6YKW0_9GAMM|nr:TonB-dependent receptor [Tahibacter aquaticus]TDR37842.1 iron complex outermembrane receptor protein [Tahibacter aquaticus]